MSFLFSEWSRRFFGCVRASRDGLIKMVFFFSFSLGVCVYVSVRECFGDGEEILPTSASNIVEKSIVHHHPLNLDLARSVFAAISLSWALPLLPLPPAAPTVASRDEEYEEKDDADAAEGSGPC